MTLYIGSADQNHPQEKQTKKAMQLSKEALQTAEKRAVKGKGERETHLNAEFQTARG